MSDGFADATAAERARVIDLDARSEVRLHFDRSAARRASKDGLSPRKKPRERWLSRFYYEDLYDFVRDQVEPGARVLDLGCGDGDLLASLSPSVGVGVDISPATIEEAKRRHPELEFACGDIEQLPIEGSFDYVIVSNTVGFLSDVWTFFRQLRRVVNPSTRVILTHYNALWEPVLSAAQRLRLKQKEPLQNWLSRLDLRNVLELADFEVVRSGYRTPLPIGPPRLMKFLNRALMLVPFVQRLGLTSYVVAHPSARATEASDELTCSIVIPTHNERGNIRSAIDRTGELGAHTEIIFVDGNSTDGTAEEIESVIAEFPERDISLIHQGDGIGKGDAVRKGFAAARGDVLMILDADLTVAPEELPKFWAALTENKGEFINGTRLVYPMENQAMRLANIAGNKFFSLAFTWILGQRVTDTLCGTKVLRTVDYKRISANRDRFGDFDPFGDFDLLFGASNLNLRIREVPIRYRARTYGETSISRWKHGVLLFRMAIKGARMLRLR